MYWIFILAILGAIGVVFGLARLFLSAQSQHDGGYRLAALAFVLLGVIAWLPAAVIALVR